MQYRVKCRVWFSLVAFGQWAGGANDITTFVSLAQTDGDVGGGREEGNLASGFSSHPHLILCYEGFYLLVGCNSSI